MALATKDEQFRALCKALDIDTIQPEDALSRLRDTSAYPTAVILAAVGSLGSLSTFRGVCGVDGWVRHDMMAFQESGGSASGLKRAGVRCLVVGDVKDEVSVYIALCLPCCQLVDAPLLDRLL